MMERKILLGEISKNFWEFDWVRAHRLMTSYYALLPVITRYYPLLPVITLYGVKKTTR